MKTTPFRELAKQYLIAHPTLSDDAVVTAVLTSLPSKEAVIAAVHSALVEELWHIRRVAGLKVEQTKAKPIRPPQTTASSVLLRNLPSRVARDMTSNHSRRWLLETDKGIAWMASPDGQAWLATKEGKDWQAFIDRLDAADERAFAVFQNDLTRIISDFKKLIRLELTEEFLRLEIAVGNGRRVTWGSATIEDHERRAALLTSQGVGTLETAAKHLAAIDMLRESGVETLLDYFSKVA